MDITAAAATARLAVASRLDIPVPEAIDYRGEGVVDFVNDRVWLRDRATTERFESEPTRSLSARLAFRLLSRTIGRERDLYFDGGALATWTKRKGWSEPTGDRYGPKFTRHPLCIWTPVFLAPRASRSSEGAEEIRGCFAAPYEVTLTPDEVDNGVWAHIAPAGGPEIKAVLWLDAEQRIRRMSYQSSFDDAGQSVLWSITELWDFGAAIDARPPA